MSSSIYLPKLHLYLISSYAHFYFVPQIHIVISTIQLAVRYQHTIYFYTHEAVTKKIIQCKMCAHKCVRYLISQH